MSFRICLGKLEAIIANANFEVKEYPAKSLSHTSELSVQKIPITAMHSNCSFRQGYMCLCSCSSS